jgi:molybdopterin/thiamine biosynthesis adenylyltransferase
MTLSLRVPVELYTQLRHHLEAAEPNETGTFALLGTTSTDPESSDLLLRELVWPEPDDWSRRGEDCLTPTTAYINRAAVRADRLRVGVGFVHSHPSPFHPAALSWVDVSSTKLMFRNLAQILGDAPLASLVFTPTTFSGVAQRRRSKRPTPVDAIRVVGGRIETIPSAESVPASSRLENDSVNERQLLALGDRGQARIEAVRVGVVGVGGTGSAVAEQLVRIGVKNLTLIDDDTLSPSNVTRVYGTRFSDAKRIRKKVQVVAKHLRGIRPDVAVTAEKRSVIDPRLLDTLTKLDFVFCCTDTDGSRAVLNDIAYRNYVPVLDLGCRIDPTGGRLAGIYGRVRYLRPGLPCLWCTGTIDGRRVLQEAMNPEERARLAASGYGGMLGPQPSVIHLTTMVASLAIQEFLTLVAGVGPAHDGDWLSLDLVEPYLRRVTSKTDPHCRCLRMAGAGVDGALLVDNRAL